jgi:uncharacterized protein YyaL (SSP411 family)
MLHNVQPEIESYPGGYSNWLDLLSNYQNSFYEVVVVGKDAVEKAAEFNTNYIPNKLLAGSTSENNKPLLELRFTEDETLYFVCVNNACKLPVTNTYEAIKLIE